MNTEKLMNFL